MCYSYPDFNTLICGSCILDREENRNEKMTTNMAARVSVSFVRRLGCFRNLSPICRPAEVKARSMVDLCKTKTVADSFQRINCRSLSLNPEPDSFTSSTSSSSSSTTSRDGLQLSDSCVKV